MSSALDPRVSEFDSEEQAQAYDRWLRAKVEASLRQAEDPAARRYSTDEVARALDTAIQAARVRNASGRLA